MTQLVHPSKEDITLSGVLAALGDPIRLKIFKSLMDEHGCMSCSEATPCDSIPKSTLSNHFRIMREAGLIRTTKKGVEHRSVVRMEDLNELFPGLIKQLMKQLADRSTAI